MKSAIALDAWKLPIFEKRLTEAGFVYAKGPGLTPDTVHLYVTTDELNALSKVVSAANAEARASRLS